MFAEPKLQFRTEKQRSYVFFKNRRFRGVDPPEGLEVAPDNLAQIFLEIRALTIRARPSGRESYWAKTTEFFWIIPERAGSEQGGLLAA